MVFIIICIVLVVVLFVLYKRSKKYLFDNCVMINGNVGGGKSLLSVKIAINAINKAHAIWYRRTHWYSKLFSIMKNEEEPLLYSNIPIYYNRKKNILFKWYRPLLPEHLSRKKRFNFRSVILIDESSLVATSLDYKDKELSEDLSIWLKLIRHELHGTYRNLFGTYPNLIINTQSKNDNHFAFDRCLNQVLYIFKNINIPFFRLVYVRDLLLIDSVENEFKDDIKEDLSVRWFLVPKKYYNRYNSYAYSFLSDDFELKNLHYKPKKNRFIISTFHNWREITKSNEKIKKESEVLKK